MLWGRVFHRIHFTALSGIVNVWLWGRRRGWWQAEREMGEVGKVLTLGVFVGKDLVSKFCCLRGLEFGSWFLGAFRLITAGGIVDGFTEQC